MARRKKDAGGPGSGDWLNTYADMVTLLLTFFILLFSMSSLDAAKFNMLVTAFASDRDSSQQIIIYGEEDGDAQDALNRADNDASQEIEDLEDIYNYLKDFIESQSLSDQVQISQGEGYVYINFMDDMLFEPNSSSLRREYYELLDFVGTGIKAIENDVEMICFNGHTAAIPDNPNYAVSDRLLSSERANAVLMYFENEVELDPEKLLQVGWGKWQPIADNDTEAGRAQNRRVEILISSENLLAEQLDNVYEKLVE